MSGRFLGVDLGARRIGLALSEPGGVVSPLAVLAARPAVEDNAKAILEVVRRYAAEAVVVGLPLNMDGTEGPQARKSRSLAEAVGRLGSLPVHLHDERLTSHAADRRLVDRELTRKQTKARQDAVAAQILLESFLTGQPG